MKKRYWFLCITLQVSCLHAQSPLIVIYDSGDTQSIATYLPKVVPSLDAPKEPANPLPYALPITTHSMQVGDVPRTVKPLVYLHQPLFLIGADKRSRAWLIRNKAELIAMGAIGQLIQVDTYQEVEQMAALAKGLRMTPASAEDFAADLGLTHYPVLLSRDGWEQ